MMCRQSGQGPHKPAPTDMLPCLLLMLQTSFIVSVSVLAAAEPHQRDVLSAAEAAPQIEAASQAILQQIKKAHISDVTIRQRAREASNGKVTAEKEAGLRMTISSGIGSTRDSDSRNWRESLQNASSRRKIHEDGRVKRTSVAKKREKPTIRQDQRAEVRLHSMALGEEHSGLVEVRYGGEWGFVCDDYWDFYAARVVCRQLGYSNAITGLTKLNITSTTLRFFLDNVNCKGTEESIDQCQHLPWKEHNCDHSKGAGVSCLVSKDSSQNHEVRLLSAPGEEHSGLVEVQYGGEWGFVCDDHWDFAAARVVCWQLGYSDAIYASKNHNITSSTFRFFLDDVQCLGTELSIGRCKHLPWKEHNCDQNEGAGVTCQLSKDLVQGAEVRLLPIPNGKRHSGLVEVLYGIDWGVVCDDRWNIAAAQVVCRQLGYSDVINATTNFIVMSIELNFFLHNVECNGTEESIHQCKHLLRKDHNSDTCEAVGVKCRLPRARKQQQIPVRVVATVPGQEHSGMVEVHYKGEWGAVCDGNWDFEDARVVCRQLGYGDAINASRNLVVKPNMLRYLLGNVDCIGTENSIDQCKHMMWQHRNCGPNHGAGVTCHASRVLAQHAEIRLLSTEPGEKHSGLVEVKYGDEWGNVCDDDWNFADARVVCRQLGYSDAINATSNLAVRPDTLGFFLDDVECNGTEESIYQCKHQPWKEHNCDEDEGAGVKCQVFSQGTCGGELNSWGTFRSPNISLNYLDDLNCTWKLQAAPEHEAMVLQIRRFSTEPCCDHLRISDNLGFRTSYSGKLQPRTITLGSSAIIHFLSDHSETSTGFEISFTSLRNIPKKMELTGHCGRDWPVREGWCYALTSQLSWDESQQSCGYMNASLADVHGEAELSYIIGFLKERGVTRAWLNGRIYRNHYDSTMKNVTWTSDDGSGSHSLLHDVIDYYSKDESCLELVAVNKTLNNSTDCNARLVGVCRKTAHDAICGRQSRGPGTLTSPDILDAHRDNISCTWIITTFWKSDSLSLYFDIFTLDDCCDYLMISDGSGFQYNFSGVWISHLPKTIYLQSPAKIMYFASSSTSKVRGRFSVHVSAFMGSAPGMCRQNFWIKEGDSCFMWTRLISWGDSWRARYLCQAHGGYVAEITSSSELQDVTRFFKNNYYYKKIQVWIGLKRLQHSDSWRWETGRPLTFSNWEDGQPDHFSPDKTCAAMNVSGTFGWIATNCDYWLYTLCMLKRI